MEWGVDDQKRQKKRPWRYKVIYSGVAVCSPDKGRHFAEEVLGTHSPVWVKLSEGL